MTLTRRAGLRLLAGAGVGVVLAPLGACRRRQAHQGRRIAVLQYVDAPPVNATRAGLLSALAQAGFAPGNGVELLTRVAGGSQRRCTDLAAALVREHPDLLVAIGTPPLLAALAAAPATLPVVFCYCSNPWGAGAGLSASEHRANVTGSVTTNPVADQVRLARALLPGLQRIGLLYNPAEPNASFEAELLAQAAAEHQLSLVREAVVQVSDLAAASQRLRQQGVEALLQVGDYITQQGVASLARWALQARVPLIGVDPAFAALPGCLAVVGWDPRRDGRCAGAMAVRVLRGTSPATMPFERPGEPQIWLNRATATRLGLALPAAVVAQAAQVLG